MEQTVFAYYQAILRRDPSSVELSTWRTILDTATDIAEALDDFAIALCSQADDVRSVLRLYQAVFDRMSDSGGLTFWTDIFRQVQEANPELSYRNALIETIGSWLESDEYVARFGDNLSDNDFLSLLYLNILGRPSDQGGHDFWLSVLQSGALTRQQLIVEFTESDEFKAQVDAEADALLKAAAAIDSDAGEDDLPYDFPDGHPYTGELANEAPLDILEGQAANLGQNATQGELAAWLRAVDPDGGEVFRWSLIDDADGAFRIADPDAQQPEIVVADPAKLVGAVMSVRVRVTDREGNTFDKDIAITIDESNSAPFDLELSNRVIDEQDGSVSNPGAAGTVVGLLSAQDADTGDILVFEVVGDPRFDVANGNQLIIADPAAFDAEAGVVSTSVTIRATDRAGYGLSVERTFTIDVTPIVDEDPINLLPETLHVPPASQANVTLTDLLAQDPDTSTDSHTFSIIPGGDPTGGAFAIDGTGTKLVLVDPSLLESGRLIDGLSPEQGGVDLDGTADGFVVFDLQVRITDSAGNSFPDTIRVTVNQNGELIRFTESAYEILDGTSGNDLFVAEAGVGIDGPIPGESQTANSGDIADGGAGHDTFELIKLDNNDSDLSTIVDGVALRNIEAIRITSLDKGPVIFDAALSPDIDQVAFDGGTEAAGIWNLQADFWTVDPSDPADAGPVVNINDTYGNFVWIDSDAQAKQAETASDALRLNLNNSWITELRITENATSGQPGGPQSEQVGTINIHAQGTPSGIGSLVNGWPGGELFPGSPINIEQFYQPTTHTLNLYVDDLTGTRPNNGIDIAPEAIDLQAIDLFVGQLSPIGAGLTGLEDVNVIGDGDVLLIFATTANDTDGDGNGYPLEVVDGSGNGLFFFHEDGFINSRLDTGGGSDLVAIYTKDLDGRGRISNVERLLVADAPGEPGKSHINLGAVQDSLEEVNFHGGVTGDLRIVSIPSSQANPRTRLTFDQDVDLGGSLPSDFDLFLATENAGSGIDAVFRVDPAAGATQRIDNFNTRDIETLHLQVEDSDATSDGLFEISHLASQDFSLKALLLSDNGTTGTTRILNSDQWFDDLTATGSFAEANPLGRANSPFIDLNKIDGTGGLRNQEFLKFRIAQTADLKFLPVMEEWSSDTGNNRPVANGRFSQSANVEGALVVSDNGVTADLGEGNDMITGNQITADGSGDSLGADFIRGNGGNDLIFGAQGNDQIEGGSGYDELQGGADDDRIWGDAGDDLILAGFGDDYADGGGDHDVIFGEEGDDVLRGGSGDDAITGDDGDDDLFGDADSDLLIGGRGDDLLDAGHDGSDTLVGDYGSEGRAVTLTIPSDMRSWDEFTIAIDWDGDQVTDFIATMIAEPYHERIDIAYALVNQLTNALSQLPADIGACFDISVRNGDIVIKKMAEDAPFVEFSGLKDAFAPVHKSELGGAIGDGDTFTWDVTWSGGSNIRYSYEFDASNPGDNVRQVLSSDGLVDTAEERLALAADIVAHFEFHRPAEMAVSSFWMKLDEQGNICLNGPGNLDIPTITVSAEDGTDPDFGALPQVSRIDFGSASGFLDIGDVISLDVNTSTLDAKVEVTGFMSAADMTAQLADRINSFQTFLKVTAAVDPNDEDSIILTSLTPGAAGFTASVLVEDDTIDDQTVKVNILDFGPGDSALLEISSLRGLPTRAYEVHFDTDIETSMRNFVDTQGDAILSDHDLVVDIVSGRLTFTRANLPFGLDDVRAGGQLEALISIQGVVSELTLFAETGHSSTIAPFTTLLSAGVDGVQDLTQSLTTVSQTPGVPVSFVDYEETIIAATEPGQDVFVASARPNNLQAFNLDGYDNDQYSRGDAFGLMKAAGHADLSDGPDEGVSGVVHVLDFNQGGGGDLLNTFDLNEAFSIIANSTIDGRFWQELTDAFGTDDNRRQGDKLAFRKSDGQLDECGTAVNYAEQENGSASRDGADVSAVDAFSPDSGLRYYVDARTFEDALLDNHGFDWGIDITQAIVDDALADLADDGQANNSAGGLANGTWGNAADLLGGADATNAANSGTGILDQAKGESWLRVYYNEAGTDAAPEAVMELVGLNSLSQFSFEDIVGDDCITDTNITMDPVDLWQAA